MAGGSFGGTGGDDELVSGINVTPLVDVVLVLLVIFLMTAPVLYKSAIQVQLPKSTTATAGKEAAQSDPLKFTLSKDGALLWNEKPVAWEELPSRLEPIAKANPESAATLEADQATPHGTVIRLMDALRSSGITRFSMSVETAPARPPGALKKP
jgi:biopolymer transport protein ExbD